MAYRLLLNDTFPSWGYSIKQGATTIWERWDGWTEHNGFQDPGMNSFNHYSLGSVGEWLYRYVAGIEIDPEKPGYAMFLIQPHPDRRLTYATASYNSISGRIESGWRIDGDTLTLDVTVPVNTKAIVYVPADKGTEVLESGRKIDDSSDIVFAGYEDNRAMYTVGSGKYRFTSTASHLK